MIHGRGIAGGKEIGSCSTDSGDINEIRAEKNSGR